MAEVLWSGHAVRLQVESDLSPLVVPQHHHLAVMVGVSRAAHRWLGCLFTHSCLAMRLPGLPVDRHCGVLNEEVLHRVEELRLSSSSTWAEGWGWSEYPGALCTDRVHIALRVEETVVVRACMNREKKGIIIHSQLKNVSHGPVLSTRYWNSRRE